MMKLIKFKFLLLAVGVLALQVFLIHPHTYRFCNMSPSTVTVIPDWWACGNPDPVTIQPGQSYDFSEGCDIKGACIGSGAGSISSCGDSDKNFIRSSHSSSRSLNLTQNPDGSWNIADTALVACRSSASTSTTCSASALQIPAGAQGFTYSCVHNDVVQVSGPQGTSSSAYVPFEYFSGAHNAVTGISTQNGQVVITYDDTKFVKDTNPADDISNLSYRFHNAVDATGCMACTAYRLLSPSDNTTKIGAVITCLCGSNKTNVIIPTALWSNTNPTKVAAVNGQLVASYVS